MRMFVYCPTCRKLVSVEATPGESARCLCHTELELPLGHDVFVSYSSKDFDKVREVAAAFTKEKINYWLGPEQVDAGDAFPTAISAALERAKVLVLILSSHAVQSPWIEKEVIVANNRKIPVLPLLIEAFDLPGNWKFNLTNIQYSEDLSKLIQTIHKTLPLLDDPEEKIIAERLKAQAQPITPSQLRGVDPQVSPYVGPGPYKEGSTHRLYGRFPVARELCRSIRKSRLTLVYSPSGAGKSSLFNTLVWHTLSDPELGYKVYPALRVGTTSLEAAARTHNVYAFSAISSFHDSEGNPQRSLTKYLATLYTHKDALRRILIFDQFEELFTQYAEPFAKPSELHKQREEFLHDLINAMEADDRLHVVLIIREEYLARMNRWLKLLPAELSLDRFPLNRLGRAEARDAITCPAAEYTTFDDDLVDEILDELEADGAIELVHLQIVCQRMWEGLPPGITRVQKSHIERARGGDGTCQGFVKNAVKTFYQNTIREVAQNQQPPEGQSRFPEELIYLGCKKFVASQSMRAVLRREAERTGRLPNWIVSDLENKHLLRSEERGHGVWYELSHDLLVRSVEDQSNPDINSLLYAAEVLDKTIDAARDRNAQSLEGYFASHDDLLRAVRPFKSQLVLFEEEAEFIFRASLVAGGEEMMTWSDLLEASYSKLHPHYLAIHRQVLREALVVREIPGIIEASEAALTRHNAATLLGERPAIAGLLDVLTDAALNDDDDDARRAAAFALVKREDTMECYARVVRQVAEGPACSSARDALARMRVAADRIRPAANQQESAPILEECWRHVPFLTRALVRLRGWKIRFEEGLSAVPYIFFPAALLAAGLAAVFKVPFAQLNWALCQASASAGMGLFHGATAGVIWGGGIALALAIYGLVLRVERSTNNAFRPFGAVLMGALAGFFLGLLVVLVIAVVYEPSSLFTLGWKEKEDGSRYTLEFWRYLFVTRGFGWPYPITGAGLGVGMALMTNALLASETWLAYLDKQNAELSGIKHVLRLVLGIARVARPYFLFVPPAIFLSAVLVYQVMKPGRVFGNSEPKDEASWTFKVEPLPDRASKATSKGLYYGLIADCATEAFGSFFAVVGMGFGMVIMRCGFRVKPRVHKPWRSAPLKIPNPAS